MKYLVSSITTGGQSAAVITDAVSVEYAATSKGLDNATVYVIALASARVFQKAAQPTISEMK